MEKWGAVGKTGAIFQKKNRKSESDGKISGEMVERRAEMEAEQIGGGRILFFLGEYGWRFLEAEYSNCGRESREWGGFLEKKSVRKKFRENWGVSDFG